MSEKEKVRRHRKRILYTVGFLFLLFAVFVAAAAVFVWKL